jgi:hypothetical protein
MARPNWLEELAENLFRMKGYVTQMHVPAPKAATRRGPARILDLLAFDDKEFVMVELQTYVTRGDIDRAIEKFADFDRIPSSPEYKASSKGKKTRKILIGGTTGNTATDLTKLLRAHNVEFIEKEEFYQQIIGLIRPLVDRGIWPYPDEFLTRILYDMVDYELIK